MGSISIGKRFKRVLRSPRLLLISAILVVLSMTLLFANKGLWRHLSLRHDVAIRTDQLTKLQSDELSVSHRIALLRLEDGNTIERIARERYNMKRPGETIYRW
jgi:cell division protein FtsB